jgi:hypothetical protein
MKTPRLLQALFAAVGDYYLFKLAKLFWGENAARWTVSYKCKLYIGLEISQGCSSVRFHFNGGIN